MSNRNKEETGAVVMKEEDIDFQEPSNFAYPALDKNDPRLEFICNLDELRQIYFSLGEAEERLRQLEIKKSEGFSVDFFIEETKKGIKTGLEESFWLREKFIQKFANRK